MKILVLGGTYFIGAAIAATLQQRGHTLTIANRGTRPAPAGVRQVLFDRDAPRDLGPHEADAYDVVVDVSAYRASQMSASRRLLSAPPARYVLISSAAVYDRSRKPPPFREDMPATGDAIWGDYGVEKVSCEAWLQAEFPARGLVIRPPYVCGPGEYNGRESFVFARLLKGWPILIPGAGSAKIQFCDVHDLAEFVADCAEDVPPGVYNIGEPRAYSLREWIEELAQVAGAPARFREIDPEIPARSYFPFRNADLVLDVSRWQAIARRPATPLRKSVAAALEWSRASGALDLQPTALELASA